MLRFIREWYPNRTNPNSSALPDFLMGGKGKGKSTACAMHAAGLCRFGSRCRNAHIGDAGSDAAKKAYMRSQEGQGDKGSKGQDGKGKGKDSRGKGKKGKDGVSSFLCHQRQPLQPHPL